MGTGFLQGKASESSPPHQSASQTASPQGEAAGRGRSTALIPFVRNDSPSPPSWGAGRSLRRMQGRRPGYKKSGIPRRISQTRVGRPEGRNSPLWCSFLHFSQETWRPPAGTPPGALRPEAASEARPEGSVTHGGQAPGPTGQGLTCAASKWYGVPTPPRPRHKKGPGQPARSFLLRYCRVG